MAGLFEAISTEDPNFLSDSEKNAQRAEDAANRAEVSADDAAASAADAKDSKEKAAGAVTGVGLWNDRFGYVVPEAGDYTADMVGARADTWVPTWAQVTGKPSVATLNLAQTFTGVSTFNGQLNTDKVGLAFGGNGSSLSFNSTTNDLEIMRGDSTATIGVEADGKLFTRANSGGIKSYFATDSTTFASSITASYKFLQLQPGNTTYTLSQQDASAFALTLSTNSTSISISSFTLPDFAARQITLLLTQGSGSNMVTWPSNIKWSQGRAPVLSMQAGAIDIISFMTIDNGITWLGFYNGGWF